MTCSQAGSSGGGGWSGELRRAATAGRGGAAPPAGRGARRRRPPRPPGLSGSEHRFSTTTRSASASASLDLSPARRRGGADGQARDEAVDGALAGHGADVEAEHAEGPGPFGRLDGHPVGAAQAERHDGDDGSGHGRGHATGCAGAGPPGLGVDGGRALPSLACPSPERRRCRRGGVSGTPTVLLPGRDGVARVTINRPERRNAMSWEVMRGLRAALADAAEDPDVRVVVLAGAGDDAFCAGADLGKMTGRRRARAPGSSRSTRSAACWPRCSRALWGLGKPTVARVQGFALAGGFGLALACDLVVASERARFGAPEVNVGLWPYMITVPMVRSMPPKQALELMLTGRMVDAAEAQRLGFVTRVVPHDELDAAVAELAETLASKSPAVMKLGRDAFYAVWDMAAPEALAHLHAMLTLTAQTEDAAEGIAAFLEKRPPQMAGALSGPCRHRRSE